VIKYSDKSIILTMNLRPIHVFWLTLLMMMLPGLIAGCERQAPVPLPASPIPPTTAVEATLAPASPEPFPDTPSPAVPSPTPEAVAFQVNGEPVLLAEFQAEMALFLDSGLEEQAEDIVLEEMINQVLLSQAAFREGFWLDEEGLEHRLAALVQEIGGQVVLAEWMEKYGYSSHTFEKVFSRAVAAAWMRDRIIEAVPEMVEQVRVRQLLFNNLNDASQSLAQVRAGTSFASLALRQDPIMGGDLGWFPRGYLQESVIEEAAFALQAGDFSEVIETSIGYHILQMVERDPQRPLEQEARLVIQSNVLRIWLEEKRSQSEIELSLP
jgi:peptidyl-prolyl cis-trans isomerase C